jgi:hypothetical protein
LNSKAQAIARTAVNPDDNRTSNLFTVAWDPANQALLNCRFFPGFGADLFLGDPRESLFLAHQMHSKREASLYVLPST